MSTLTPTQSAKFANAVYGIKSESDIAAGLVLRNEGDLLRSDTFDVGAARIVMGSSGAGIRATSGFTMVIPPKGSSGEYIVTTRGTASIYDGLSDLMAALEPGPGGHQVHAGFNRVAQSVMGDVLGTLRGKNPSHIHCIGHSLGGAIANLLALQLNAEVSGVSLYTFGAPRTGCESFCQAMVGSLGAENIYRCFNLRDPVPMVPIYPYLHAPTALPGALVGAGNGPAFFDAHFLTHYIPRTKDQTWEGLRRIAIETPLSTEDLLQRAAESVRIPGLGIALHWLGRALGALLGAANRILGSRVTGGLTVLDRMSWMLVNGKAQDAELEENVKRLATYILAYAGVPVTTTMTLSVGFLNYLLGLMLRPLLGNARRALVQANT